MEEINKNSESPDSEKQKLITPSHQWQMDFLWEQFKKESDRAAVILTVSIIDDALYTIIKAKLVPIPSSKDPLFDEVNSPFTSFSSKIDIAYRLGIISSKLCRDLHLLRKIRNSFAHDIYDCNFNNMSVKGRVNELKTSMIFWKDRDYKIESLTDTREFFFLNLTAAIVWKLNTLTKSIESINETELEWLYDASKKQD